MDKIIKFQKKIAPESLKIVEKRYYILKSLYGLQPIGRRGLSNKLSIGERIVRAELEILRKQGLIEISPYGMTVTKEGKSILQGLEDYIYKIRDIKDLEIKLENILDIAKVKIVAGSVDRDKLVLADLGKLAADYMEGIVNSGSIIGVTGGSTVAAVAAGISRPVGHSNVMVVPARGGMGPRVENQSNTIAAEMARGLQCKYYLLHASDTLEERVLHILLEDPQIQKVVNAIKSINLLIFGIGRADVMAKRRNLSSEIIRKLDSMEAVAEAFGYFFTKDGDVVYQMKTVGISYEDFKNIPTTIAVAGGKEKAQAIMAVSRLKDSMILITDQAAAFEIIKRAGD